jgi:hypothetical protein
MGVFNKIGVADKPRNWHFYLSLLVQYSGSNPIYKLKVRQNTITFKIVSVATQQPSKLTHTSLCNNECIGLMVLHRATYFRS